MARPSKALVVALLFTSALAMAAGMPQQAQQQQQQHVSITDIKRRIDDAVQRSALSSSSSGSAAPFAGCSCKQECRDKTQKVCSVRNVVNKVCRTIDGSEDILECTTKCFSAGKAMATASSAAPSVDLDRVMGGRRLFEAAAGDSEGAAPREVCREICKPSKMPTSREVCDDVAEKTYECREETVATHCNNVCSCGNDVRVVFKQAPIAAAAGKRA